MPCGTKESDIGGRSLQESKFLAAPQHGAHVVARNIVFIFVHKGMLCSFEIPSSYKVPQHAFMKNADLLSNTT